jgi:hypothetical protein
VSRGRLVAAVGGIALLVVMFLPWFRLGGEAGEAVEQAQQVAEQFGVPGVPIVDTEANAFESFALIDLVLLAAAVTAIGLAVAAMIGAGDLPPAAGTAATGLGALAALLVLYRLIDPPDVFEVVPGFQIEVERKLGAFLGLIAAAAVAAGSWMAMQEEGVRRRRPTR